jgi:phage terminase large subunit-like protein
MKQLTEQEELIKKAAEDDLVFFIRLIAPHRVLGTVHEDMIRWWCREDRKDHQLVLMPRDHQKSAMIAYRVAWQITRDPTSTFLYISSTSGLAEAQLYFIKNIFESKVYQRYWPEMICPEEGKREKWTQSEIMVDHPIRKQEGVRDATIKTAGLTTSLTGFHFTHAVMDDVVVRENAYTEEGRQKVRSQYSLLASIESTGTDEDSAGAEEWIVGTRYDPRDLYSDLIAMTEDVFDENGEKIGEEAVYEVWQMEVEDRGDGTGEFLWPRQQSSTGKWFGFDDKILARKRAKYLDKSQFRAQYYNNPNDPDSALISRNQFQYYDQKFIHYDSGHWYFKESRLNVFAAIDFAFSLNKRADYTAIVVIGMDADRNVYILDIDRFKTDKISVYFEHIMNLWSEWQFRRLRAEVTVAQATIVTELKEEYIKQYGLNLSIDEHRPSRNEGTKEERMEAILEPRYSNGSIWHYRGGNCQTLEEELILTRPPHDDVKDTLAIAIDAAVPPRRMHASNKKRGNIVYNTRFGGIG